MVTTLQYAAALPETIPGPSPSVPKLERRPTRWSSRVHRAGLVPFGMEVSILNTCLCIHMRRNSKRLLRSLFDTCLSQEGVVQDRRPRIAPASKQVAASKGLLRGVWLEPAGWSHALADLWRSHGGCTSPQPCPCTTPGTSLRIRDHPGSVLHSLRRQ